MRAVIHIHRQTFNLADKTEDEIAESLQRFAQMILKTKNREEGSASDIKTDFVVNKNQMIVHQWVYKGVKLFDILKDSTGRNTPCPTGIAQLLRKVIYNHVKDEKSVPQQVSHLRRPSEDERHGICVINRIEKYQNIPQVVADYRELVEFRLNHYFEFPDSDKYFDECDCYLDNLSLQPDIKSHYKQRYKTHQKQIHKGLLALNFHYLEEMKSYEGDYRKYYRPFSHKHGFDNGSGEGNPAMMRSHAVKFEEREEPVTPDPHLKFNFADDGSHEVARIYFETPTKRSSKIYITHILQHLNAKGKRSL